MFKTLSSAFLVLLTFFLLITDAFGQNVSSRQEAIQRLNQLEAEARTLNAEVQRVRQDIVRLPSTTNNPCIALASTTSDAVAPLPPVPWSMPLSNTSKAVESQPAEPAQIKPLPPVNQYVATQPSEPKALIPQPSDTPAVIAQPAEPQVTAMETSLESAASGQEDYYTLDELKGEMKKLVWKKGDFSITPYGYVQGNMVYETERSYTGDYAFYILSAQDFGERTFHVDAKSTRLGVDLLGPKIACLDCAQSGGKVEIDFQGSFTTENKGSLLLRHAYFEIKDEEFRLLVGQTWDVISPLNPNSIMYSIYWGAGNIGYRRAQFRGERFIALSDDLLWTSQGSLNTDIVSDTATGMTGDHSEWPVLEGRTALTFGPRGKGCHPIVFGVSSHVGEQLFTFTGANAARDLRAKTWSLNVDLKVPVTDRLGFQGEWYTGENLGAYLGGILQGYNPVLRRSIYDNGGWMEAWYYWNTKWHSHVGYTVDDPLNSDIISGGRTYNSAYWGNLCYDVTKQFMVGFEASSWRTLYNGKEPGESARFEFMARYGF